MALKDLELLLISSRNEGKPQSNSDRFILPAAQSLFVCMCTNEKKTSMFHFHHDKKRKNKTCKGQKHENFLQQEREVCRSLPLPSSYTRLNLSYTYVYKIYYPNIFKAYQVLTFPLNVSCQNKFNDQL